MNSWQSPVSGEPALGSPHYFTDARWPTAWDISGSGVTSWTTYTGSAKIPTGSTAIILLCYVARVFCFRKTGSAKATTYAQKVGLEDVAHNQYMYQEIAVAVNGSKQFDYIRDLAAGGTLNFAEIGYWM